MKTKFTFDFTRFLIPLALMISARPVSAGVIVLRKKQPERPRGFRVPFVPLIPILSILMCVILMMSLPLETWIRFFVWLIIGLGIYFLYSRPRLENAK